MSKIARVPVPIPEGVTVEITGQNVVVRGPKGELTHEIHPTVTAVVEDGQIVTSVQSEKDRKFRGLTRTLLANMVEGVTQGYEKKLHVIGVGFDAQVSGQKLNLSLGFSHKIHFDLPAGIAAATEKDPKGHSIITLTGIDKQLVGETAAKIRALRKPEPYKGKGVRYFGENIKLKPGKAAAK